MDVPSAPARHAALRVIVAILLGILANLGAGMGATLVGSLPAEQRAAYPWLMGAANHAGMLIAAILLILMLSRGRLGMYGFRRPGRYALGRLLLWSGCISALVSVLGRFLPGEGLTFMEKYSLWQTILFVWIFASLAEEVVSRGLVQGFLAPLERVGISVGNLHLSLPVMTGALFFGATHLMLLTTGIDTVTVLQIVIFAVAVGLVAGYYRERSGSLWPAFLAHASANVVGTLFALIAGG